MSKQPLCYSLASEGVGAVVVPGHGGLIESLRFDGHDVLWRNSRRLRRLTLRPTVGVESAREFDGTILVGGWFPMFPTAGQPLRQTQQHGWAPRVEWSVVTATDTQLVAHARGPFANGGSAQLHRTTTVSSGAITVSTNVVNVGDAPGEFTFGEHPCFARSAFAGGELSSPEGVVRSLPDRPTGMAGHEQMSGHALTVEAPRCDSVLGATTSSSLPSSLLWESYGAESLPHADTFAWEPCSAAGLGFGDARALGQVSVLEPGDAVEFHISVTWRREQRLSTILGSMSA